MVHGAGDEEITRIVEVDLPDRLAVLRVGRSALSAGDVPHLYDTITRSGGQEAASRMERDAADPVLVALATHEEAWLR